MKSKNTNQFKNITPGKYIAYTTSSEKTNKGESISFQINISARTGELGVYLDMTEEFVKVADFRKDMVLKRI